MGGANPAGGKASRTIIEAGEFARIYEPWCSSIEGVLKSGGRWAVVGIKERGAILARRLWNRLRDLTGEEVAFGEVDISLYRDDYHLKLSQPRVLGTEIPFSVDGLRILLVDDVLFTGRTVRAALDQILDFGRPRRVLLAVLIDRGHRELPIAPDFVGQRIETAPDERVEVYFRETDGEDRVELFGG
jgi:pyrimidine operon attenuation protein / uracil phosphoribosyltransferase